MSSSRTQGSSLQAADRLSSSGEGGGLREYSPSREKVKKRHEQGRADDRPENRKGLTTDVDHKGLRQVELVRDPRPEEGSDEPDDDGRDQPARAARESPADGAADGRNDEEHQKRR